MSAAMGKAMKSMPSALRGRLIISNHRFRDVIS